MLLFISYEPFFHMLHIFTRLSNQELQGVPYDNLFSNASESMIQGKQRAKYRRWLLVNLGKSCKQVIPIRLVHMAPTRQQGFCHIVN